jgi:dipeptidase E
MTAKGLIDPAHTLILASSGKFITPEHVNQYLARDISTSRIAYITTAADKVDSRDYFIGHQEHMHKLGYIYDGIDIATTGGEELRKVLRHYDVVMVEGGNTFYLLDSVRKSGFANIVKELLTNGVVYVGISAGAYIACPSIVMATWSNRGYDRCGVTDYSAMNLVPFLVKAHYLPAMEPMLKEKIRGMAYPLRAVSDRQAVMVKSGEVRVIGTGEEVVIGDSINNKRGS